MKRIKKVLKKNVKLVIGIIIGAIVSGIGVYAATTILSQSVGYDNTSSGLTSANVQDALDELYTKANTWINPNDFGIKRNTAKTVMATPGYVCIKMSGIVYCFTVKNYSYNRNYLQQVFSGNSCEVDSHYVTCTSNSFACSVTDSGYVDCYDTRDGSGCYINSEGSITCD